MALIKCPACNRKVSTDATSCPGCGDPLTPVAQQEKSANTKTSGGTSFFKTAFYLVGWAFFVIWLFSDDTNDFLGKVAALTSIDLRTSAEVSKTYEVTATTLNQRSCGSPNCGVVGKLSKGDVVRAYDVEGRWVRVSAPNSSGSGKWVSADYLREDTPKESSRPSAAQAAVDAALDKISKSPVASSTPSASPRPNTTENFYQTDKPNCGILWVSTSLPIENASWSGACKGGMADGFGTLQYALTDAKSGEKKTSTYVGNVRAGERQGTGTYVFTNGNRYEGEWQDNFRRGKGTLYYTKSGNKYEGEFLDGKRHGYGTFYSAKNILSEYEGYWANDQRNGSATIRMRKPYEENRTESEYKDDRAHGKTTTFFPDGSRWVLDYQNGTIKSVNEYAPDGTRVPDLSADANAAIDKFRFAQNKCGNPRAPSTLRAMTASSEVNSFFSSMDSWRDCNWAYYEENLELIRQLVIGPIKGYWVVTSDTKVVMSDPVGCNHCLDRASHLLGSLNNLSDAYERVRENLDDAIEQERDIIKGQRASNGTGTYNELERALNAWNTILQQNYDNVWAGYSGPTYRPMSVGLVAVLRGG